MSAPPVSPASVLLALSHRPSRELLSGRLRRMDVEVRTLDNGTDAQREIQECSFEVVVAETRLPGRVGLELLRSFPTLQPPFVLLGRQGNDEEIVRAFELGAVDYLTLPFSPRVATARILRAARLTSEGTGANEGAGADSHSQ